jgi:TP901 family phage tail tape measure protein
VAGGTLIDTLRYEIELDAQRAVGQVPGLVGSIGRIGPVALGAAAGIATIGAVAVPALQKATNEARKFETAWAEVRTIMSGSAAESAAMAQSILDLSTAIPEDAVSLAKAYYQVISAGVTDSADAQKVLAASSKAAIAGVTDTATAVDAVTTIMNSYGMAADEAEGILDVLFQTVKEGKIEFNDIASGIGKAVPFFAAGKVPLEELGAAIATLTKGGIGPEEAMTSLKNVIVSIVKPSDEAKETAKRLGIEFNAEALAAKGLVGFLNEVEEKTQGSAKAQAELFGDIRSLLAVMALAGKQNAEFNRQLAIHENSAGTVATAYEHINATLAAQEKILKGRVTKAWIDLGNAFLPVRKAFVGAINDLLGESSSEVASRLGAQAKAMKDTRGQADALIKRYQELSMALGVVTPDTAEYVKLQGELADVTKRLAEMFPSIVTAYDSIGRAIGVNVGLLEQQLDLQEKSLAIEASRGIGKIADEYNKLGKEAKNAVAFLRQLKEAKLVTPPDWTGLPDQMVAPGGFTFTANTAKNRALKAQGDILTGDLESYSKALQEQQDKIDEVLLKQKQKALDLAAAVRAIGVDNLVTEWESLNQAMAEGFPFASSIDKVLGQMEAKNANIAASMREQPDLWREVAQALVDAQGKATQAAATADAEPTPQAEAAYIARGRALAQAIQRGMEEEYAREVSGVLGMTLSPEEVAAMKESLGELWGAIEQKVEERRKAEEEAARAVQDLYEKAFKEATERGFANLPAELRALLDNALKDGKIDLAAAVRISSLDPLPDEFKEKWTDLQLTVGSVSDEVRDDVLGFLEGQRSVGTVMSRLASVSEDVRDSILNGVVRPLLQMSKVKPDDMQAIVDIIVRQANAERDRVRVQQQIIKETQDWGFLIQAAGDALGQSNEGLVRFIALLQSINNMTGAIRAGDTVGIIGSALGVVQSFFASLSAGRPETERAAARARALDEAIDRLAQTLEEFRRSTGDSSGRDLLGIERSLKAVQDGLPDLQKAWSEYVNLPLDATREQQQAALAKFKAIEDAIKEGLEEAGIDLDLPAFRGEWGELAEVIERYLQEARNALLEFALFIPKTFEGMNSKIDYLFDNLDIDDPREQLALILDEFKKLTGIDMSKLKDLSPEKFNEVIEGFVQLLMTGKGDMRQLFDLFNGDGSLGDLTTIHKNPAYQILLDISKTLGLSLPEVVKMFQELLLESGLTGQEVQDLIDHLEDIGDELADDAPGSSTPGAYGVSRNVSITEQQGDTLIGGVNTMALIMRSVVDRMNDIVNHLRDISSNTARAAGSEAVAPINFTFSNFTVQASSQAAGSAAAVAFVTDVEERVRSMGFKVVGQRGRR